MNKIFLSLFVLFFSLSATSDELLIHAEKKDRSLNLMIEHPEDGFNFCQINQNILYSKALSNLDFKINYLNDIINNEANVSPKSFRLISFQKILSEIITERIWIEKIQKQMFTKSLYYRFISSNHLNASSFLGLDNDYLDLKEEISRIINKYNSPYNFLQNSISNITSNLVQESSQKIPYEYLVYLFKGEASQTISALIKSSAGKGSASLISPSVTTNFMKEVLLEVGKGALLDLAVKPLQAYTYTYETQWTNALEITPLLIIDPDIYALNQYDKKFLGLATSEAWSFHCAAMIRKTSTIESIFNLDEKRSRQRFFNRITQIIEIPNYADPNGTSQQPAIIDNTFVAKKFIK